MMKNSKKMSKKYMKALSNQVRVRGWGQVRLGLCSKLYRDGENILVPYCQMNTLQVPIEVLNFVRYHKRDNKAFNLSSRATNSKATAHI